MLGRNTDAIDLAVGTPGYPDTPTAMIGEASRALRAGRNQYEDPAGAQALGQRIAEMLSAPTDPDTKITVTAGATEALHIALLATIDPGDEVVVFTPGFDQFAAAIRLVGGRPRFVELAAPEWRFGPAVLAAAFTARTRAVVLNTPSNPTGRVLGRDELAEVCERWNVTVICDEVYSTPVFDGRCHISVAEVPGLAERSIVVGSLSKTHAVSGWRLGFLRADPARTRVLQRVHQLNHAGHRRPVAVRRRPGHPVGGLESGGRAGVRAARSGAGHLLPAGHVLETGHQVGEGVGGSAARAFRQGVEEGADDGVDARHGGRPATVEANSTSRRPASRPSSSLQAACTTVLRVTPNSAARRTRLRASSVDSGTSTLAYARARGGFGAGDQQGGLVDPFERSTPGPTPPGPAGARSGPVRGPRRGGRGPRARRTTTGPVPHLGRVEHARPAGERPGATTRVRKADQPMAANGPPNRPLCGNFR